MREPLFVGRSAALERLDALFEHNGTWWLHVHGIGGIGKSTLLRRWLRERPHGSTEVTLLDGEFLPAAPAALVAAAGGNKALVVDTFDKIDVLQHWIFHHLRDELGPDLRLITAGRRPLSLDLETVPSSESATQHRLGGLSSRETRELLEGLGVAAARRPEVEALGSGHPLVLCLAAELASRDPSIRLELGHHPAALRFLVSTLLGHVPSSAHRRALELLACHALTDESTLRGALGAERAPEVFDWLCSKSFVDVTPRGLVLHSVLRRILLEEAMWRDAEGFGQRVRQAHEASAKKLAKGMASATGPDPGEIMNWANISKLRGVGLDEMDTSAECSASSIRSGDEELLAHIAGRHYGEHSARIAKLWMQRAPETVVIGRGLDDEVQAFVQLVAPRHIDDEARRIDPFASMWEGLIASKGVEADACLLSRFALTRAHPMQPSNYGFDFCAGQQMQHLLLRPLQLGAVVVESLHWETVPALRVHPRHGELELDGVRFSLMFIDRRGHKLLDLLLFEPDRSGAYRVERSAADEAFAEAVGNAMKSLHRSDWLADSPLVSTRIGRHLQPTRATASERADGLRAILTEALERLGDGEVDAFHRRLLYETYFVQARKQRAIADDLGMGYSTYRRHLAQALDRLVALLWERECALAAEAAS